MYSADMVRAAASGHLFDTCSAVAIRIADRAPARRSGAVRSKYHSSSDHAYKCCLFLSCWQCPRSHELFVQAPSKLLAPCRVGAVALFGAKSVGNAAAGGARSSAASAAVAKAPGAARIAAAQVAARPTPPGRVCAGAVRIDGGRLGAGCACGVHTDLEVLRASWVGCKGGKGVGLAQRGVAGLPSVRSSTLQALCLMQVCPPAPAPVAILEARHTLPGRAGLQRARDGAEAVAGPAGARGVGQSASHAIADIKRAVFAGGTVDFRAPQADGDAAAGGAGAVRAAAFANAAAGT